MPHCGLLLRLGLVQTRENQIRQYRNTDGQGVLESWEKRWIAWLRAPWALGTGRGIPAAGLPGRC